MFTEKNSVAEFGPGFLPLADKVYVWNEASEEIYPVIKHNLVKCITTIIELMCFIEIRCFFLKWATEGFRPLPCLDCAEKVKCGIFRPPIGGAISSRLSTADHWKVAPPQKLFTTNPWA